MRTKVTLVLIFLNVALFFVTGSAYLLGGALFIAANVAFGASIVVYNSFLPDIATPSERDSVSSISRPRASA